MTQMTSTTSPFEGKGGVIVDPARGRKVLVPIVTAYLKRQKLYRYIHWEDAPQNVYLPENIKRGSVEHARWLFFAAMSDRREQSKMVYQGHRGLWEKHADLLYNNPLSEEMTDEQVGKLIKPHGFGMWSVTAKHWVANSHLLFNRFLGDPRFIYEGRTINDIVREKKYWKLSGFGPKILSLLAMFYAESEMIELPEDAFPIDVHVQRIALSTGIIQIKKTTTNVYLEAELRPLLREICREKKWSMVDVAHALWFLGNQMCTECSTCSLATAFCPAYGLCGGPFESKRYFTEGKWDPDAKRPTGDKRSQVVPSFEGSLFFST